MVHNSAGVVKEFAPFSAEEKGKKLAFSLR
jgi:hypothetical protein